MDSSIMNRRRQPVGGSCAWTGAQFTATQGWSGRLSHGEVAQLVEATKHACAAAKPLESLTRADFPLTALQPRLRALSREIAQGRGFALLRGVPVDDLTEEECKVLVWGVGLQLGVPVSQSRHQNFIAEVRDVGEKMGQETSRGYRAGGPLRFHTDQCDVLGLMCTKEPISGGHSRVVSSAAIHDAILESRPDLLDVLYQPFSFSRQGEEVAGEAPWYARPIFDRSEDGGFMGIFSMSFIESAQRMDDVPRLDERQREALALVARLADELSVTIELRKGDMQFFNNHVVFHSRTDYQDHDEPQKRRTQLRLWLATPGSRRLPPGARVFFGSSEPGVLRGGVTPPSGRRFAFASWSDAGWTPADLAAFRG